MSLSAGEKLGPYEILSLLGKGGMGEVYRARDTRLNRDVALKVSAERFSERFEREARLIAALNHTNVCTLYDVGPNYLVMELVEGPTLAERIAPGPIGVEESLRIARQMADALEAAHEKGIVHRDLKPANVKFKPDGTVKVLDFGLAKAGGAPVALSDNSPTLTMGQTEAGVILGTTAYMSPEQAKGKPVDKRADIWAFGVVLYEMLTGRRLFTGETTTEVLAAVIEREPKWERIPSQVQLLLRRCLEKDPKRRLRDIADAMPLVGLAPEGEQSADTSTRRLKWLWPAAAATLAAGLVGLAYVHFRESPPAVQPVRFEIPIVPAPASNGSFSISPDGRHLVFPGAGSAGPQLWIHDLDSLDTRSLSAANVSAGPPPSFWSPDSRFLAFQGTRGGRLNRIDISGGPAQVICDGPSGFIVGGSWNPDGTIIFGNDAGPLARVPAGGGTPVPVTALDPARKETSHVYPVFLPDGRHFIYLRRSSDSSQSGLYVGSLDAKPGQQSSKQILAASFGAVYVPSRGAGPGQLLFLRDATLMAVPFDAQKLELAGDPVAIAEQVASFNSYGFFTASLNGVLIYRIGGGGRVQLRWQDEQGKILGPAGDVTLSAGGNWDLSPDGKRLAEDESAGGNVDVYIRELTRSGITRFTFDPAPDTNPVWSPDGSRIAFASNRGGKFGLYVKSSNLAGEEQLLFQSANQMMPTSWSSDGAYLLFTRSDPKTHEDLWALPLEGKREPFLIYASPVREGGGRFSPDSKWIAYTSDESGNPEVWVRPFVPPGKSGAADASAKWQVSSGGSVQPHWRKDGKELFFRGVDGSVLSVEVAENPVFNPGVPRRLFLVTSTSWGVAPDGRQFLTAGPPAQAPGEMPQFNVILNWQAALKK